MEISTLLAQGNLNAPSGAGKAQGNGDFSATLAAAAKAVNTPADLAQAALDEANAGQPSLAMETLAPLLARLPVMTGAQSEQTPAPLSPGDEEQTEARAGDDALPPAVALVPLTDIQTSAPATPKAAEPSVATPMPTQAGTTAPAVAVDQDPDTLVANSERGAPPAQPQAATLAKTSALPPAAPAADDSAPALGAPADSSGLAAAPASHTSAPAAGQPTPLTATLQAPVASAPWQQELNQQMLGFSQRGEHHIELHLHPRELGPLSVSLKVDDNGAQAQFFSAHASVRSAVEQAIPQLREALAEQGIALGDAMVGQQQQQQSAFGDAQRQATTNATGSGGGSVEHLEEVAPLTTGTAADTALVSGMGVDLYA